MFNKYNYCDSSFDAAALRGDSTGDQTQRLSAYSQAQKILENGLPVIPLLHGARMLLVRPGIQNLTLTAVDDYPGDLFLNLVKSAPP